MFTGVYLTANTRRKKVFFTSKKAVIIEESTLGIKFFAL